MSFEMWCVYLIAISVLIITPGPMAILNITNGLYYGGRRSLMTAFGGLCASLTMMTVSACGLGAILAHSKMAFLILQWAGGLYLMVIGFKAFFAPAPELNKACPKLEKNGTPLRMFRRALLTGLSNPKELLFFGALFPQFMNMHAPQLPQLLILGGTWSVVDLTCMIGYAFCAQYVSPWFKQRSKMQLLNRASGTAYIGIATAILSSAR